MQAGLTVLEEMDELIFNKKLKIEPFDIKPKIEPKKETDNKDSSRDIKNEPIEIISGDTIFVVPVSIKRETADAELQTGLDVLQEMDESIFTKHPKIEPLDIKAKEELDNKNSLIKDIKDEPVEIISDDTIFSCRT